MINLLPKLSGTFTKQVVSHVSRPIISDLPVLSSTIVIHPPIKDTSPSNLCRQIPNNGVTASYGLTSKKYISYAFLNVFNNKECFFTSEINVYVCLFLYGRFELESYLGPIVTSNDLEKSTIYFYFSLTF